MKQDFPLLISVVICTYNRAELLRSAVQTVLGQETPSDLYEIIIVDNSSTDDTPLVVQQFQQADCRVRYVLENRVGLSYARNRGMQEARGEYIAYLDDDCKVPPSWLNSAQKIILQEHPEAFGGPHYAFYNTPKPVWFKDAYESHTKGNAARPLQSNEYLNGMNMFIRMDVLKNLGGFNPLLGMNGKTIAYGEETELFCRMRKKQTGAIIYYAPEVFVYHLVRANKLLLGFKLRMSFIMGRYYTKIFDTQRPPALLELAKNALLIIKSITWDTVRRDRKQYPFPQNYLFEVSSRLFFKLGYCFEHFTLHLSRKKVGARGLG